MGKINRGSVYAKYDGHCAYCGKKLETIKDMQVDHMTPKWRLQDPTYFKVTQEEVESDSNYMPTCRRCNHYKREKDLEQFRKCMATLHERVQNDYITKVAIDYGIVQIYPFDGIFYFEKLK